MLAFIARSKNGLYANLEPKLPDFFKLLAKWKFPEQCGNIYDSEHLKFTADYKTVFVKQFKVKAVKNKRYRRSIGS